MNASVLRLLDANLNRAREALRVVEDYARFILNDDDLSGELKQLRHDLSSATGAFVAEAILHRDTPGDVGTGIKTGSELRRQDLAHVVTAAGKRLGEALRAVEEYLKTISPPDAAIVEALRYQFYDLEQRIAFTLGPGARAFTDVRLYVLITESLCRLPWLEAAEQAIVGGADCLQLREKTLESGELLRRARQLVQLCRRYDVPCIINDRPDIALLADADGVHVGQDDLPPRDVRKLLGPGKILGVSTHNISQAKQAVLDGADYIGVGPFFRSSTKPRDFTAGPAYAREVAGSISIPGVAIAGITAANANEALATGLRAAAVSSAVLAAADVKAAAAELKRILTAGGSVGQTSLSVTRAEPELAVRHRYLPHWTLTGSTYFVTFRVQAGVLSESERSLVLDHVRTGHQTYYTLLGAVVMPDHVHLIIRPKDEISLTRITKGTKGVTARLVNIARSTRGHLWQEESWDRIIRDQSELEEKLAYIVNNPVKAGLVNDGWDYEWLLVNQEAE